MHTTTVNLTQDQLRTILAALDDYEQTIADQGGNVSRVSDAYDAIDAAVAR